MVLSSGQAGNIDVSEDPRLLDREILLNHRGAGMVSKKSVHDGNTILVSSGPKTKTSRSQKTIEKPPSPSRASLDQ